VGGAILIILGFSSLKSTEIGLDYSWIAKDVNKKTYENGLHYLGIGHSFIKFPRQVQTIEFSKNRNANGKSIQSRTKDGLEVSLEIAFQFTLDENKLYSLFEIYGQEFYLKVFTNIAIDVLTDQTTHYTAYDFFNKRAVIKTDFETVLKKQFLTRCFSDVNFLQLITVDLPNPFENAISQTEVKKQDINVASAQAKKTNVELETKVKSALYQKDVTLNLAVGNAKSIQQQNTANVNSFNKVQTSQTNAYSNLKKNLKMKNKDLLKMIKTQVIGDYDGDDLAVAMDSPEVKPTPAVPVKPTVK